MTHSATFDGAAITDALFQLLRLKTTPICMKLFERVEDMLAVPRIRRPEAIHTADQIVGQAARLGFTVGVTAADLVGPQCSVVLGLSTPDADWNSGKQFVGVWFATEADAARMFSTFATRWRACDNITVNVHVTPTSALQWRVTDVRQSGDILSSVVLSGESGDPSAFPTEHAVGLSGDCIADVDVAVTDVVPARRVATTRAVDLVRVMVENIRRGR